LIVARSECYAHMIWRLVMGIAFRHDFGERNSILPLATTLCA
jgi:hypothetical protein